MKFQVTPLAGGNFIAGRVRKDHHEPDPSAGHADIEEGVPKSIGLRLTIHQHDRGALKSFECVHSREDYLGVGSPKLPVHDAESATGRHAGERRVFSSPA